MEGYASLVSNALCCCCCCCCSDDVFRGIPCCWGSLLFPTSTSLFAKAAFCGAFCDFSCCMLSTRVRAPLQQPKNLRNLLVVWVAAPPTAIPLMGTNRVTSGGMAKKYTSFVCVREGWGLRCACACVEVLDKVPCLTSVVMMARMHSNTSTTASLRATRYVSSSSGICGGVDGRLRMCCCMYIHAHYWVCCCVYVYAHCTRCCCAIAPYQGIQESYVA